MQVFGKVGAKRVDGKGQRLSQLTPFVSSQETTNLVIDISLVYLLLICFTSCLIWQLIVLYLLVESWWRKFMWLDRKHEILIFKVVHIWVLDIYKVTRVQTIIHIDWLIFFVAKRLRNFSNDFLSVQLFHVLVNVTTKGVRVVAGIQR